MITIETTTANLHVFLALTGHAFEENKGTRDLNCSHGFWWAWRWLQHQVRGGWKASDEEGQ